MNLNQSKHVTQSNGKIYSQVLEKKQKQTNHQKLTFRRKCQMDFHKQLATHCPLLYV